MQESNLPVNKAAIAARLPAMPAIPCQDACRDARRPRTMGQRVGATAHTVRATDDLHSGPRDGPESARV